MSRKIIDKDRPLPEHTIFRYEECYAKTILEYYFSDKYENIIIEDKPDLYDIKSGIGIEVVEAIDEKLKEARKLWYMMPYEDLNNQLNNRERMHQLNMDYQGNIQVWPTIEYLKGVESEVYSVVYRAIENKLKKLNKKELYKEACSYNLFVISELTMNQDWYEKFINKVQNTYTQYKKTYDIIYLLSQNDLAEIDMKSNKCIRVINIDNVQCEIARRARRMVENGEISE